jgi:SAM-dependent methyltransferase
MIRKPLEWFLGIPWVFQKARFCFLGGFDFAPAYQRLEVTPEDVVLDVGCGMGDAMRHLNAFRAYHGFDTDCRAIEAFRNKYSDTRVKLYNRECTRYDIKALAPTKCVLIGVLHHLDDQAAVQLLHAFAHAPRLRAAVTVDTIYLRRKWINNSLAVLDRGRHVRTVDAYQLLFEQAGLRVLEKFWITSGNRAATYYCTKLAIDR